MQIFYLSNERIPSRYANTIQQMHMCHAFVKNNARVHFYKPYYPGLLTSNQIFSYYGLTGGFKIKTLPSLLALSKPPVDGNNTNRCYIPFIGGVSVLLMTHVLAWYHHCVKSFKIPTAIYSRSINMAHVFLQYRHTLLAKKPVRLFLETHALNQQPVPYYHELLRGADGIIVVSHAFADELVQRFNISRDSILVCPDGVNLDKYNTMRMDKPAARAKIGIQTGAKKIICYTGSFLPGKGLEVFLEAARFFHNDVLLLIVGGSPEQVRFYKNYCQRENLTNVMLTGFVMPAQVPVYQQAADILVLPNTSAGPNAKFTSPLKLFEYMAAQRPIVATRLPVFQEVLQDARNAILVAIHNPLALADGIRNLLENPDKSNRIAETAFADVEQYTWENRARRVIEFMQKKFDWN